MNLELFLIENLKTVIDLYLASHEIEDDALVIRVLDGVMDKSKTPRRLASERWLKGFPTELELYDWTLQDLALLSYQYPDLPYTSDEYLIGFFYRYFRRIWFRYDEISYRA